MEVKQDYDLTKLNTFGISTRAKFFVEINNELEIKEVFNSTVFKNNPKLFLGRGSNILFTQDFPGIVVLNKLKGIEVLEDKDESVFIKSMSGEVWHDLVEFTVDRNYWGIENLALIPGTVGAAPMQNIGAYGVELKDTLQTIEAIEVATGEKEVFKNSQCEFGYRDSVFKNELKNKYFITAITLKLKKQPNPKIAYKSLSDFIEQNKIDCTNPKDISEAVIEIRQNKLPNPKIIGNAGSFFKNVFLDKVKFEELLKLYPNIPFSKKDEVIKIPTAWLIEECGWKGYKQGKAGVHDKQALVLVNYGGATGEDIKGLAEEITASVFAKFGIRLNTEVNLV
jgi:UDP-N-acetylmuramate dehydrogenase